jgi:hypothetical protein
MGKFSWVASILKGVFVFSKIPRFSLSVSLCSGFTVSFKECSQRSRMLHFVLLFESFGRFKIPDHIYTYTSYILMYEATICTFDTRKNRPQ